MNFKVFLVILMLYNSFILKGIPERLLILGSGSLLTITIKGWHKELRNRLRHICISLIAAHLLMLLLFTALSYRPIEREPIVAGSSDTIAVILLLEGEPEDFTMPVAIYNILRSLKPYEFLALPYEIFKNKILYDSSLTNDFYANSYELQQQLQVLLGSSYKIYLTYTKKPPYLQEGIFAAMEAGNDKIIFAPVLITENDSFLSIEGALERINTGKYQIITRRTEAMWNSDAIALLYVSRINQANNGKVQSTGVLLLGSDSKGGDSVTILQQEVLLREKVKELLIEEGYISYQIQKADFNKRNIEKGIDILMEYGVSSILVVNTSSLYEGMEQQIELLKAIKSADMPESIDIKNVYVTAYESEVVYELVKRINLLNID